MDPEVAGSIPANGTSLLKNQNVLLEPSIFFGSVDLGQDRLAGRSRLGSNGHTHPFRDGDVMITNRHSRQGTAA